ncbi:MAG: XRE family transcriptional regulator [Clostridiales Family XIII bacterium]|nr:XRE family transcriptional regulator [Clostridiales Family XIII bacterium]
MDIGKAIKNLRAKNHITLRELAEKSGLSIGFLSQLERGMTSVAIDSLQKISGALGVEPDYFFHMAQKSESSSDAILRKNELFVSAIEENKYVRHYLTANVGEHHLLPEIVHVLPEPDLQKLQTDVPLREAEEFVYVLRGILTVHCRDSVSKMYQGDSLSFGAKTPHGWRNDTNQVTRILVVHYPNPFFAPSSAKETAGAEDGGPAEDSPAL